MLEASSIRSRKHSSSSMDLKSSNTGTFAKEKTGSSMANDSGTSLSGPFEKMSESFLQAAGSGKRQEHDGQDDVEIKGASPPRTQRVRPPISEKQPGSKTYRGTLSAEDLGGGLLDGTLDDVDDEDLEDVTEDTDVIREPEGIFEGQGGAEGNEEDGGYEKHKKQRNLMEAPDSENNGHGDSSCTHVDEAEAQHPRDHDGDDGDVAMVDQEDDDDEKREEEATPVAHTDDESELPEDEGSHVEDEDADAEEDEEDEVDEEDEEDEGVQPSKLEAKKATSLYSQKPTLNRPAQVIEEDVKDSGDEKDSDDELSDPVDTDDSDSDEEMADRSSKAQISAAAFSGMAAVSSSRPALGGRKRSLRGASRNTTQHEDSAGLEADNHKDTKDQRWDKGSESETLEENGVEEENAVEEETVEGGDDVEDEDHENGQLHSDALMALTAIEEEFATLRDKMYNERMLELDREVEMINDGTHPELSTLMREIEEKREHRLRIAKAWLMHTGKIVQCEFESKEHQAHCTYQSKKRELRKDITTELGKRKQKAIVEMALSSDVRRKNMVADKLSLVRARRHRRVEASELRSIEERYGFPATTKLRMISTTELDEDLRALGLPGPALQSNTTEYGLKPYGRILATSSSPRPSSGTSRWSVSSEYLPSSEVEVFVDGNHCKVDGTWYKPNDYVAVLDAAIGQYNAKYLFIVNDEIMLQKMDGSKMRLHLNLFRGKKLYMQPRP